MSSRLCVLGQESRAAIWGKGLRSYEPVENVRQLFSRTEWESELFGTDVYRELPGKFVSALFKLKADQDTTVRFQAECRNFFGMWCCFSNAKRTMQSVKEILQAMYPTLRPWRFA